MTPRALDRGYDSQVIGFAGEALVRMIVTQELKWIFRDTTSVDYGIDAYLEGRLEGGRPSGVLIGAQIKSGSKPFRNRCEDGWLVELKEKNLRYWKSLYIPVILIIVDLDAKVCYWQHVLDDFVDTSGGTPRLHVLETKKLDMQAEDELNELIIASDPYIWNVQSLRSQVPYMELVQEGKDIRLSFAHEPDNENAEPTIDLEQVARSGNKEKRSVIASWTFPGPWGTERDIVRTWFSWANLSADDLSCRVYDEDLYEAECLLGNGGYGGHDDDSRTYDEPTYAQTFDEWRAERFGTDGYRPYSIQGTSSMYDLEVTINPLGEAFLELDEWASSIPHRKDAKLKPLDNGDSETIE